jgi:hypothetical protein
LPLLLSKFHYRIDEISIAKPLFNLKSSSHVVGFDRLVYLIHRYGRPIDKWVKETVGEQEPPYLNN